MSFNLQKRSVRLSVHLPIWVSIPTAWCIGSITLKPTKKLKNLNMGILNACPFAEKKI